MTLLLLKAGALLIKTTDLVIETHRTAESSAVHRSCTLAFLYCYAWTAQCTGGELQLGEAWLAATGSEKGVVRCCSAAQRSDFPPELCTSLSLHITEQPGYAPSTLKLLHDI